MAIVVALAVVAVGLVGYLIAGAVGSGPDTEAAGACLLYTSPSPRDS